MALSGWQCVAAVSWVFGTWFWLFDLPNHLLTATVLLALFGLIVSVVRREVRWAIVLGVCLVVHGTRWASPRRRGGALPAGEPVLRILVANVLAANRRPRLLLDLVAREEPDVVAVMELTHAWRGALGPLRQSHPYHLELPRQDSFGIALYSRLPLSDARRDALGSGEVPAITAAFPGLGTLWLVHTLPPLSRRMARERDAQLADVAQRLTAADAIVVGDLNCTQWSGRFPGSTRGWPTGTWPASLPDPLRLPIDHGLTGRGLQVVERRALPSIGSDHRPVLIGVRPR